MTRSGPICLRDPLYHSGHIRPNPIGSRSAAPDVLVGRAVAVGVDGGLAARRRDHVDIRVIGLIVGNAGPDLEYLHVALRAVLEAMAVRILGGEPCRVARAQYFFTIVGDQHDLPGEHIDELVAAGVPMTLARPRAGRQATQIDPELGHSGGIAELGAFPGTARHIERRWVERADHGGKCSHIDPFVHLSAPLEGQSKRLFPASREISRPSVRNASQNRRKLRIIKPIIANWRSRRQRKLGSSAAELAAEFDTELEWWLNRILTNMIIDNIVRTAYVDTGPACARGGNRLRSSADESLVGRARLSARRRARRARYRAGAGGRAGFPDRGSSLRTRAAAAGG